MQRSVIIFISRECRYYCNLAGSKVQLGIAKSRGASGGLKKKRVTSIETFYFY